MRAGKAPSSISSRYLFIILLVTLVLAGCNLPANADAPIKPGGPFVPKDKDANRSAIMTFEEVETELYRLRKRSKGAMTISSVGTSVEGRPLYVAKLGTGPQRMWIQGRIHGDEPFGNDVCLEIIQSLLSGDKRILEVMTFWIIPCYNPDGSAYFMRRNANRIDLNRNWYRPFGTGYTEPESKAFYWAWAEFKPHYAIDIHHQQTYFVEDASGNDTNQMTAFSVGISMREEFLAPRLWDASRRMAVAGYDAVRKLGFCNPSRYPLINIPSTVVSSMMLGSPGPGGHDANWKTAAMFLENRGGIGNKSRGYIIRQNVVAVDAIIDAIANDWLASIDEERWNEIPDRGRRIYDSDKWSDEWAERYPPASGPGHDTEPGHSKMPTANGAGNESEPAARSFSDTPAVPAMFALHQNIPNPFNPATEIQYDVPNTGGKVTLRIYDVTGRLMRTLVDAPQTPGRKRVAWDGRDGNGIHVTSGVYFYRLTAPGGTMTRRMVLVK